MNIKNALPFFLLLAFCLSSIIGEAKQTIKIAPQSGDMTMIVREALEKVKDQDITIEFEKGIYHFHPDYAEGNYYAITNHDNGYKNIIFPLEDFTSVEILGNGAEFIFHGSVFPFRFSNCRKVTMSGVTMDWNEPFTFQGELISVDADKGYYEIKPATEGFSWNYKRGKILFPNIDGFSFSDLGSTLSFDKEHKRVVHGAIDKSSHPEKIEKLKNGNFRIYDELKGAVPIGSIINYKGDKGQNRYAPAIQVINSENILFDKIVIHHALGMGFLFEKSSEIVIKDSGVYLRKGTERVVSSTADATHFCNCKGDILIEGCRFENMLDDGTNVHGTYVEVNKIVDEHTAVIELKHFQQMGFEFAGVGDELWFIHQPNPQKVSENTVTKVHTINERFIKLSFKNKLPAGLKTGDILENKTWNPTFTMQRCTIQNHRARSIVLKTPKKIVIENNYFSSMMSAVFFRGETFYWFESGIVEDVLVRNNTFDYCAYSGMEHAVMYVTPRLGKKFDQTMHYDRNIRFVDNKITTYGSRIIWADRVDGITITGNTITEKPSAQTPVLHPEMHLFQFTNCKDVHIKNNSYQGKHTKFIKTDKASAVTLKVGENRGIGQTVGSK